MSEIVRKKSLGPAEPATVLRPERQARSFFWNLS